MKISLIFPSESIFCFAKYMVLFRVSCKLILKVLGNLLQTSVPSMMSQIATIRGLEGDPS